MTGPVPTVLKEVTPPRIPLQNGRPPQAQSIVDNPPPHAHSIAEWSPCAGPFRRWNPPGDNPLPSQPHTSASSSTTSAFCCASHFCNAALRDFFTTSRTRGSPPPPALCSCRAGAQLRHLGYCDAEDPRGLAGGFHACL